MDAPKEGWEVGKEPKPEVGPKAQPEAKPEIKHEVKPEVRPEAVILTAKPSHPPFQLIFFVALGFGLAAAAFSFFSKSFTKVVTKEAPKAAEQTKTIVEVVSPAISEIKEETHAEAEKPLPTLTLSGILFGDDGSFALINGRVVPEGGKVEGAILEKVSKDRVELSFEGKKIILRSR